MLTSLVNYIDRNISNETKILEYIKQLKFEEKPSYDYIRRLFDENIKKIEAYKLVK